MAETITKPLVYIILAILSFAIIVIFLMSYNWNSAIDKKTCFQSVTYRSTINLGPIESSRVVPLKCKTEKVCISSQESCPLLGKSTDIKIKLSKEPEKAREEALDAIAESLYDCNEMLGGGKLNFMPNTFWSNNYCLICTRVAFDNEAKKLVTDISYAELYKYLQNKKTRDGKSYLEAIYEIKTINEMELIFKESSKTFEEKFGFKPTLENVMINSDQTAIISQIVPKSTWLSWTSSIGGGLLIAGGIAAVPFTWGGSLTLTGVGVGVLAGGTVGGVILYKTLPDGSKYAYPIPFPYDIPSLKSIGCTSFETAP